MHQRKVDFDAFALHQHAFFMFHCIRIVPHLSCCCSRFFPRCCSHRKNDCLSKTERQRKTEGARAHAQKINNIKHVQLWLTKIFAESLQLAKFCKRNYYGIALKAKHYYHIWLCAFVPEKHLITEFMHVSFFSRNYYHVAAVSFDLENMVVLNNLLKYIAF